MQRDRMQFKDAVGVEVIRKDGSRFNCPIDLVDHLFPGGTFKIEHYDARGIKQGEYGIKNLVVNQGKNDLLDTYFNSGTQITTWYGGLISSVSYSAIVAGDTAASHSGWTEFVGYSESVRQTWGTGAASAQTVTNASPMTFSINASGTVKGAFIISNSTKGGTSGKLWAAALFSSDVTVNSGDSLKVTYTLSC